MVTGTVARRGFLHNVALAVGAVHGLRLPARLVVRADGKESSDETRHWRTTVTKALLAALFLASANADPARTVRGSVEGGQEGEPVWVGVFGDEAAEGSWTQAAGASFEVALPPGERATLLVVSKNRLPHKFAVTAGSPATVAVRLAPGLALAGTVRSEDGARLADAEITIEVAEGDSLAVPPLAAPRWRSDRRGGFQVTGLRPGRHFVTLKAEGHVPLTLEDVHVRRGEDNRIEAELPIAHFIAGRVVDGNGDPVAGVDVLAGAWIGDPSPTTTRTENDGAYRLGPFPRGDSVNVYARSPGMGSTVRHNDVASPHEGLVLVLRRHAILGRLVDETTGAPVRKFHLTVMGQGEGWEHDLRADDGEFRIPLDAGAHSFLVQAAGYPPWFTSLEPPASKEVDLGKITLAPARSLIGRVLDARTGRPIPGARVYRVPRAGDYSVWTHWLAHYSPRTHAGDDGAFALRTLPQEAVRVGANAQGYGGKIVRLPPGVTHLDFELEADAPGPLVVIAGAIVRADGTPVAGRVALFRAADASSADVSTSRGSITGSYVTYENGEFRFEDYLPDGAYVLVADAAAGVVAQRTVVIRDSQSVQDVRLVVKEGGWLRISLAGVMASEGGARVTIRNEDGRTVFDSGFGNGTHRVSGVPEQAVVEATAYVGWQSRWLARRIRLDDGGEAATHFDFTARSRLTGTVTAGGRPLGGIQFRVLPADPSAPKAHSHTNQQGRYDVSGLAEGRHLVRTDAGHSFEVQVAQDTHFDIELPAVSLTGVVRHVRTGRPVSHGEVRLRRSDGYSHQARTAADGSFRFEGLAAGQHVVSVSEPGFESLSRNLWIAGDEVVELDLGDDASGNDDAGEDVL